MKFTQVIEQIRADSRSEHDKGSRFERLMKAYLQTDPMYASWFTNVWLWNDFFARKDFGGSDIGIDLVAKTINNEYWAIQCKFYQPTATIDKPAVDSFLATSGREFTDQDGKKTRFSHRLWISTTNKWSTNATETIKNQQPPLTRLNLNNLMIAPVDWKKLLDGQRGQIARTPQKQLYDHQRTALNKTHEHFKTADRGRLIMACGTGKTFNALRIAEKETNGDGLVLFLVPSIALIGQTLRAWAGDTAGPFHAISVCSQPKVTQQDIAMDEGDELATVDLALPATTDPHEITNQYLGIRRMNCPGLTVIFSTYQSIDAVAAAQKLMMESGNGEGIFDLIICDEAHRTTGVTLQDEAESAFTKVHDQDFIKGHKRLYMTATPRLYSDDAKSRAAQADAILCSMDDPAVYGEEIHRLGFAEAVERGLLSDYKVLVLTLDENDIPPAIQRSIADSNQQINTDDAAKLMGCINALSKQILGDEGVLTRIDPDPMRRAVAFCQNIKTSKKITDLFNTTTDVYRDSLPLSQKEKMVAVASTHIDGTMSAPERTTLLDWLTEGSDDSGECRILTNVRCLSEGVDVPSLDSVIFLSPRNSQVDVVQSVGRVMRKSPGKKYGYIIIPVVIPSDVEPEVALNDNERYRVVWTVLNALRAHDDRFNATVNKIELNKARPEQILIGRPTHTYDQDGNVTVHSQAGEGTDDSYRESSAARQMIFKFGQLQDAMFARLVQKVGDRRYWEQWAQNVAEIASHHVDRINRLIREGGSHQTAFAEFMDGLHKTINPAITEHEAVEMLSQHIITKPVFEAVFSGYSFVRNNPISLSMQKMLDLLEDQALDKDTESLNQFYDSVRSRAAGIDNADGKQRIIIELYDKFFKTAFPRLVEKLGIVYTPVEVVDFIIKSVNDVLQQEFGRSLTDENVNILDPFTGTGTFITRLFQSGLINKEDLTRKYSSEIFANEIVLLAYYIAAVNIENAYHDIISDQDYRSFEGICLTDTFQLGERDHKAIEAIMFPENSERVNRQTAAPLRVIVGNPPYSVGQRSANDDAPNQEYPKLDSRVGETYAARTNATNKNSLYDAYIKSFRWASDRLDPKHGGIICFVTNGAWLDGNAQDGFRKCLEEEFSSIYVFNLRGNARTQGELRRKEAGNVFAEGSRTPIAITLLVKNPARTGTKGKIYYHDIGDYLNREEKLSIIKKFGSILNPNMPKETIKPNKYGDWINKRSDAFAQYVPLNTDKKFNLSAQSFFVLNSRGIETCRDAWSYNSSLKMLTHNMESMVNYYNLQVNKFNKQTGKQTRFVLNDKNSDPTKISWSSSLVSTINRGLTAEYEPDRTVVSSYRPFFKQHLYMGDKMLHRRGQNEQFFPTVSVDNRLICVPGIGGNKQFSTIMVNNIPDLGLSGASQCFPLYYYEELEDPNQSLFELVEKPSSVRRDGVTNFIHTQARELYGNRVTKEDIFYYVYGFLHSPQYRTKFSNDLKKSLPRIFLVDDPGQFWQFSKAGRQLADLHINYETVPPYEGVTITGDEGKYYQVEKMRFPKRNQKDTILYNSRITIGDIPEKAYQYVVNGRSAIEWLMDRYRVTTHRASGIVNNPNHWAEEQNNPRYILDLLLSIINVSVQTVDIVNNLPILTFEEE